MPIRASLAVLLAVGAIGGFLPRAAAQQATVATPMNNVSDGFFEGFGVGWGFHVGGVNGRFGGGPPISQFGGFDPGAGFQSGLNFRNGNFNGFLNFSAAQGWRQSLVTQAPSVTMMNGQTGYFADASVTPFVIGNVPIVGGLPTYLPGQSWLPPQPGWIESPGTVAQQAIRAKQLPPPRTTSAPAAGAAAADHGPAAAGGAAAVDSEQPSSAARAAPSVAEARRLYQLEQQSQDQEAAALLARGQAAEEEGRPGLAKVYYRMAAKQAGGEVRQQALDRLQSLAGDTSP